MRLLLAFVTFFTSVASVLAQNAAYLRSGDRVVFYGDSITDQRLYTVITEAYIVMRYPQLDVTFVHSGWGGDKVTGGAGGPIDVRLERDVIPYRPSVMTIMLGMNDGFYKAETEEMDKTFFNGYRHIVDSVRGALPGVRITAIEPSPYDDVTRPPAFSGGYNQVLVNFSKWISDYARQAALTTADLNTAVVEMLKKANSLEPSEAQKIIPDRIHPAFAGHLIMAEQLLKAWHEERPVASVTIDASGNQPRLTSAEHAQVVHLTTVSGVEWSETDDALPLPLPQWSSKTFDLVLRSSDAAETLDSEPLRITGLKPGKYSLRIDSQEAGTFSNDEFEHGVNLGTLDTPMTKQAKAVYDLTVSRATVHNDRWRTVQVPLIKYDLPEARAAMTSADALEQALINKRRELCRPVEHTFSVRPVS